MLTTELQDDFLKSIVHGRRDGFRTCELIMEALSYPRVVPKSFWLDEEKALYGILGFCFMPKSDIYNLREELISLIAERIANQKRTDHGDPITTDHYARYLHSLTLLGVPKNSDLVPGIGTNLHYNTAYCLWALDDGTAKSWISISQSMGYVSEALKNMETSV